ncbi:MAG: hypothetical protein QNJ70_12535 [Xenococcaceae cyanobacterium MO_207.B15]|nr:hypothetical protein [Xenococcaceae cyanobacterium MO_207.B15]
MNNFPPALRPIYTTNQPNQNILLYEGSLEISSNINHHKVQTQGSGKLEYVWFPNPCIQFSFSNQEPHINDISIAKLNNQPIYLTLVDIEVSSIDIFITSSSSGGSNGTFVFGRVKDAIVQGSDEDLTYILFHVVNFHNFIGRPTSILEQDSGSKLMERLVFETDEWRITLDQLETTTDNVKSLNAQGGYAITHVGKLEKSDGSTFSGEEAREFFKIFADFLSFARGFYISVILLIGYDVQGNQIWEYWEEQGGDFWRSINSWCPKPYGNQLAKVFSGFLSWWHNWEESERVALNWYLEANYNPLAEQNILIAQIALDLIAWVFLVEKNQFLSKTRFNQLKTVGRLRELFSKLSIPLDIPTYGNLLEDLRQLVSQEQWMDSSQTLNKVRNAIVHPEPQKRNLIYSSTSMAKIGTAYLGLWYLELTLLAMFKYQESYSNRLDKDNLTKVPWSK